MIQAEWCWLLQEEGSDQGPKHTVFITDYTGSLIGEVLFSDYQFEGFRQRHNIFVESRVSQYSVPIGTESNSSWEIGFRRLRPGLKLNNHPLAFGFTPKVQQQITPEISTKIQFWIFMWILKE